MFNLDDLSQNASDAISSLYSAPPTTSPGLPPVQFAPPAAPNGGPGPQVATPVPVLQRGHGLLARINRHLTGDPADYSDLTRVLTPQEIENARPGLFETLFGDPGMSPNEAYNAHINALLARKAAVEQMAQEHAIQTNRAAVLQQFPAPQSGDEEALRLWANKVYPLLTGDKEAQAELLPLVDRFAANRNNIKTAAAGQYFRNKNTGEIQSFSKLPGTQIGPEWEPFTTASAGGFTLWRNPKTNEYLALPDNQVAPKGFVPEVTAREQEVQEALKARGVANSAAKGTAQLLTSANQYTQARAVLEEARTNPAASKSAVLNFAGTIDSRAQLRQGTIQFLKYVDPSFSGTAQQWFNEKFKGKLTPKLIDQMESVLDHMHYEQAKEYDMRRSGAVERDDAAGEYLPRTSEIFGNILDTYQPPNFAATAPTAASKNYSPDNPFAKKP